MFDLNCEHAEGDCKQSNMAVNTAGSPRRIHTMNVNVIIFAYFLRKAPEAHLI